MNIKQKSVSILSFFLLLFSVVVQAQEPVQAPPKLSETELQELIGPIALYPDPLLSQILPASTYPLEIVQAARIIKSKKDFSKIDGQNWDESVKAVARYPSVLKMMSDRLDWTQRLGQAVMVQQEDVLRAVQEKRLQAQNQGNLKSNTKQQVVQAENYIEILPTDPQVVYVPVYDPEIVYVVPAAELYRPVISFGIGFPFWPCYTSFFWPSYSIYYNRYYGDYYGGRPYYGYGYHGRDKWRHPGHGHRDGDRNHWDHDGNRWGGNRDDNRWDGNRDGNRWDGDHGRHHGDNPRNSGIQTVSKPFPSKLDQPRWNHDEQRSNPFTGRRGSRPEGFRPNHSPGIQATESPGQHFPSFGNRPETRIPSVAKPQPASFTPRTTETPRFNPGQGQRFRPSENFNAPTRTMAKPRQASFTPPPRQEVSAPAPAYRSAPSRPEASAPEVRRGPDRPSYSSPSRSPSFNRGGFGGGGGRSFGGGGGMRTMSKGGFQR